MKINDYALACKSSSLLKLYLANFKKEGMDKVVNYKRNAMLLEVPEAARAKALEEINDAIEDEMTDILYDYISEEGKVQFDKLSEDLLESKIMDRKSTRPISPLKGRRKREYEQSTSDYGEFYSNTWNLMGKYIMLVKAEKGSYHKVDVYCSVHGCSEVAIDYYHATILGLLFKLPLCKKHFGYLTDECEGPIK